MPPEYIIRSDRAMIYDELVSDLLGGTCVIREGQLHRFLAVFTELLAELPVRKQQALVLRYGLEPGAVGLKYKDIGPLMGITGERARQLVGVAMRLLRHPLRRRLYEPFVEEIADGDDSL